ncbi:MAG: hypothetical protein OQL19_08615, partial [Gammaproteobacteria bacterium]|nr:hypothetical protein [Gammaproteobacteria bacterium]
MCGICGDYHFDGSKPDLNVLDSMLLKLERRGPDNKGVFHEGPLALGHRRLSIIDLSERSNQPIVDNELQLALVFNGTIYNYPELRKELISKGYRFFSDGDSATRKTRIVFSLFIFRTSLIIKLLILLFVLCTCCKKAEVQNEESMPKKWEA